MPIPRGTFEQGLDLTHSSRMIADQLQKMADRQRTSEGFQRFQDETNPLTNIPGPTATYQPPDTGYQPPPQQQMPSGPGLQPAPITGLPKSAPQPITMRGAATTERVPIDPLSPEYQQAQGRFLSENPEGAGVLGAIAQLSQQYRPKAEEISPGATLANVQYDPQQRKNTVKPEYTAPSRMVARLEKTTRDNPDDKQPHTIVSAFDNTGSYLGEKDLGVDYDALSKRQRANNVGGAGAQLSPEATDALAQDMLLSGKPPAMGMGGAPARIQVYNRYAQLAHEQGKDAQARQVLQSATTAESRNLGQVVKQQGQVLAFEKTAERNLNLALAKSNMVDRFGAPVFNRWKLAVQKEGGIGPEDGADVAAFEAAVHVAANEIAKVTSTTTGNLVPQQEREEYRKILSTALNVKQFQSVADILKQDMESRKIAYAQQIQEIKDAFPQLQELKNSLGSPTGTPATPKPAPGAAAPKWEFEKP